VIQSKYPYLEQIATLVIFGFLLEIKIFSKMNSLSSVEIELFALPMIFVGIALLLSHFFEDSDRFRGFCEKLRAKYILTHKGPLEYLNT